MSLTAADLSLADVLDIYFTTLGDVDAHRPVAGGRTWRGSLLGSCLRRQYIQAVEHRPLPLVDARTQRVFQVGHLTGRLIGEAFQALGILLEEELPLSDDELDIGAHVDFLIGGPIQAPGSDDRLLVTVRERLRARYGPELPRIGVELKSKNSKSFWWAAKKKETVAGDHQLIQAACYDVLARRHGVPVDRWAVLSVSKDDLTLAEDHVTDWHRAQVVERLTALNKAKVAQDPSSLPCSCLTDWGGKGWKYCPYGIDERTCC